MDLDLLKPMFQIKESLCAGIDGLICKIHLIAQNEGKLVNEYIGIPLVVRGKSSEDAIVHEVKRVGLLIDRYVDLELRVGDHLIFYVSKSQA